MALTIRVYNKLYLQCKIDRKNPCIFPVFICSTRLWRLGADLFFCARKIAVFPSYYTKVGELRILIWLSRQLLSSVTPNLFVQKKSVRAKVKLYFYICHRCQSSDLMNPQVYFKRRHRKIMYICVQYFFKVLQIQVCF